MKKTALIILNYNNVYDTINCIESVLRYNTAPVKFVVVDNGSPRPGVVRTLDQYLANTFQRGYTRIMEGTPKMWPYLNQATLLVSGRNDGYARGNNKGLRLVDDDPDIDNVMILNNDILFVDDIIPTLLDKKKRMSDCAIISPVLLCRDYKSIDICCARKAVKPYHLIMANFFHYFWTLFGKSDDDFERSRYPLKNAGALSKELLQVDLPSGSCMLLDKRFFKQISWFDPNTFLYYEEDILHKKIERLGLKTYIDCGLRCVHLGAGSTSTENGLFLIKNVIRSQRHYVLNYTRMSWLGKAVFLVSQQFSLLLSSVQKGLNIKLTKRKFDEGNQKRAK